MILSSEEWQILALSVRIALVAVAVSLPFGMGTAFYLARRRSGLAFAAENLVQLPLVLPPVVTGYVLLIALGPAGPVGRWLEEFMGLRIAFSGLGAALAAGIVAFPLMVQAMRVGFEQIDPEWEEAAYVYGGSRWQAFRHVTLPLAARGVAAGLILAFARAVGEFGATIVIAGNLPGRTQTIPLAIFSSINQVGGTPAVVRLVAVALVLSLSSLVAYALLTRRLHRFRGSESKSGS